MSQYKALTLQSKGLLRVISTECGVSEAFSIYEMKYLLMGSDFGDSYLEGEYLLLYCILLLLYYLYFFA